MPWRSLCRSVADRFSRKEKVLGSIPSWGTFFLNVKKKSQIRSDGNIAKKPVICLLIVLVHFIQTFSSRRAGSSMASFTLTKNVTASRPSIKRWSYVKATYIMGRISILIRSKHLSVHYNRPFFYGVHA